MARRQALMERLVVDGSLRGPRATVYITPDRFRDAAGRIPHWILAVILMVLLHAFWWLWLSPATPDPAFRSRAGPGLAYLSPELAPDLTGAWVLSPALSALLNPAGIGDMAPAQQFGEAPDLHLPLTPLTYMERAQYLAGDVPPLVSAQGAVSRAGEWPPPGAPGVAGSRPVLESAALERLEGLRIDVRDGLSREDLAGIEVPGGFPTVDRNVWEAIAWIEFDEAGGVDHVFLETPSGDVDRDRILVRSLYRWRLAPEAETRRGRVSMSYFRRARETVGNGTSAP